MDPTSHPGWLFQVGGIGQATLLVGLLGLKLWSLAGRQYTCFGSTHALVKPDCVQLNPAGNRHGVTLNTNA
jgi:hypothetical protein